MRMMRVENYLDLYEINGEKVDDYPKPNLKLENHWNYNRDLVVIKVDGKSYTVGARELKSAIENATRS